MGVGTCPAPAELEDLAQEWTQAPALVHTGTQGVGVRGGPRPSEDAEEGTAASWPWARTNVPGVRKDRLFPISPPSDPNFPRVSGLSERGREAGQQCVSIVNREIQLGLHCRRSSSPAEQGGCFLS